MRIIETIRKQQNLLIQWEKRMMSQLHNAEISLIVVVVLISWLWITVAYMMPRDGGGSKNEFIKYDGGWSKNEMIDGWWSKNE